ncbi:hypothetical protein BFP76_06375 [Amylibacter kogurei]|uniref:Uncharacterized protein n=1 Tax=Paramylibacter kogurei TaxID=1889778 RepID=A0A2G5K5H1_9RHOB|nr:hypothetical protein BFP76_06375 [Amylibacter kogurei]
MRQAFAEDRNEPPAGQMAKQNSPFCAISAKSALYQRSRIRASEKTAMKRAPKNSQNTADMSAPVGVSRAIALTKHVNLLSPEQGRL